MHPLMSRTVLAIFILERLFTSAATAGNAEVHTGAVTDDRVAQCGIVVSREETMRIEPFLVGRDDLEGRLVLNVHKRGASGTSQSSQTSMFTNGTLGRISFSFDRSSDVTVEMIVMDRSGKALCELRRLMMFGGPATKI